MTDTVRIPTRSLPLTEQMGRAAFWDANKGMSADLRIKYPTGCTMAEAIAWAEGLEWLLCRCERDGRWRLMYKLTTVPGVCCAWGGQTYTPSFATRGEATDYINAHGLNVVRTAE